MYLLTGPEELLLQRAADGLLDELRGDDPGGLEVVDLRASEIKEGEFPDLRTGSLFGGSRAVVIRQAQDLPAELGRGLIAELEGTPPDATVILLATGTQRIMALGKRIKELGGRVDIAPPKDWEDRSWELLVADELRRHGRSADRDAIAALLGHAGLDVGTIAEKVAQVAASAKPGKIGVEQVEAVVVGHGSRGSFAVADAMCQRRPAEALTLLRGVLESGDDPVMVLGALTYRIRSLVAVAGKVDPKSIGLSLSPPMARRMEGVRRNFGPGELTAAYRALADADLEIKGGELTPELAVERAVLRIATPSA
jgi:DNA polymerase III subunit delta